MRWIGGLSRRLWRWLSRIPKAVLIPAGILFLFIVLFGSYQFFRFYNYTQEDPAFCRSCHLMEKAWDRWETSKHKNVTCHSCHQQSVFESARMVGGFALGRYERVVTHAAVKDELCQKCHESEDPKWLQIAATAGHRVHAEEQNLACTKCHSTTVHRFAAPAPICQTCHAQKEVVTSGMATFHCTSCHSFLATDQPLLPGRKNCLDCHEALVKETISWPADAPMQLPCGTCHKPHEIEQPTVACRNCHTGEGLHQQTTHRSSVCQTCHEPHQWKVTSRQTCLACHTDRVEHQAGALCSACHNFPAK